LKDARVARGKYFCEGCKEVVPGTITDPVKKKRVKNIFVDHIKPVIDPLKGFTTWDEFIEGLFCEKDNLQALCKDCHDNKTKAERDVATDRRKKEKEFEQRLL
jgi:5-methylcytosine-specific restriction endonuclease McrA